MFQVIKEMEFLLLLKFWEFLETLKRGSFWKLQQKSSFLIKLLAWLQLTTCQG